MLIRIWKYIQGYVIVKIYGYSPERFMNLCANRNIYIWNIRRRHDCYIFSISKKGFLALRPIARKTHCRVKILRRIGLPFRLTIFRKRKLFLIGLLLSASILIGLSLFIWKIEIEGNSKYTNEEIIKFLSEKNINVGILKNKISCEELDNTILANVENIQWVSSEIKGTKLIINIKEGLKTVDINKDDLPCDIIANKQGIITNIVTRKGTPMVKKGDVIEKGDVLVSGTLEIKELEQLKAVEFTTADAEVTIKTNYDYTDEIDLKYFKKVYNNKIKKDKKLEILDLKINLFRIRINKDNYDKMETYKQLSISNNFYLPIAITTTSYKKYDLLEQMYSKEEAILRLKKNLANYQLELAENNIQVLDSDVSFNQVKGKVIAKGIIKVIEKVGEKQYFKEERRRLDYNEYFRENDENTP
jgi:similar to stage IV sporulation protein